MASATTRFAEPKLSELVPTLTGESNFASKIAQPASDDPAFTEWLRHSRHLLSYLHATVHASLKPYINTALNAPATYPWLNSLRPSVNNPSEQVLISTFSDFVISENRRLASHPNFNSDPVFYNANAVHRPAKDAKPKHFCTFHQRKAAHTSEEYFRNPANADNAKFITDSHETRTRLINAVQLVDLQSITLFHQLFHRINITSFGG
ncbi:hypothetical protein PENVUL_c115G09965 [Penicillium vulpinum]|uniref:Uncharacterized protein n=1 Tax=Penicillium vulpinum TaxID=29845 RepID=A0A1V6R1U8_9EURO|nr:hypothetical protein PENVUL_c115G09965 [Penicillium vulpinum]